MHLIWKWGSESRWASTVHASSLVLASLLTGVALVASPVSAGSHNEEWWQSIPGFETMQRPARSIQRRARPAPQWGRDRERAFSQPIARTPRDERSITPLLSQATLNGLQRAIVHYRAVVDAGGWTPIPARALRRGDRGQAISLLQRRLALTGDLRAASSRAGQFDPHLEEAVARFQRRHGLSVTGMVDRNTLGALNVSAQDRLRQLRLNLDRLIELEDTMHAERFVLVNSASFEVEAVDNGRVALRSRGVVGRPEPDRQTPDLSTRITELNFYPYWHVPASIVRRDLVPRLRNDPDYFYRERFSVRKEWGAPPLDPADIDWASPEVYDLKFRQDPGPFNALGVVRLNMPNSHAIFLHDTPLKDLFAQGTRAFSAGCVRVERVLELAAWLLKDDPKWDLARVEATIVEGTSLHVKLRKAVPVHLAYVTAWADETGIAHFRPDIYERDGTGEMLAVADDARRGRPITP